ncbi:MAG: radical SAM family heme chaperone HemW [Pseudomonadota bacterium]|nr:radical SAM family heme chaperone HemW [Pseudomonadota bacterium]
MPTLPPLSLYIHVPWCVRKCPYCDFNSHQRDGELPEDDYMNALLADLRADAHYAQGRQLQSIFIGGGTPSLLSPRIYEQLLSETDKLIPFASDIEITLEANPGTAERDKFRGFRAAGINRLSIGVQSFDAAQLKQLGRIHDGSEALRAADFARAASFDNFNLDLMFGLPGQATEQALADLRTAIGCAPTHLSWYQLTIEPNTEFFRRPPALPQDDAIAEMQDAGIALLHQHGYARYEISAYAQPGRRARHNINYWEFGDYLGIGAGAHGKVTLPETETILRTRKTRMPAHYLSAAGDLSITSSALSTAAGVTSLAMEVTAADDSSSTRRGFTAETKSVPRDELPLEFMMNALRLCDGVASESFAARTGLPLSTIASQLDTLRRRGLLDPAPEWIRPTPLGLQYLNELLLAFM